MNCCPCNKFSSFSNPVPLFGIIPKSLKKLITDIYYNKIKVFCYSCYIYVTYMLCFYTLILVDPYTC